MTPSARRLHTNCRYFPKCARCVATENAPGGFPDTKDNEKQLMATVLYAEETATGSGGATGSVVLPLQQTATARMNGKLMSSLVYADELTPTAAATPRGRKQPQSQQQPRVPTHHAGPIDGQQRLLENARATVVSAAARIKQHAHAPPAAAAVHAATINTTNPAPTPTSTPTPPGAVDPANDDLLRRLQALQGASTGIGRNSLACTATSIAVHPTTPSTAAIHNLPSPPTTSLTTLQPPAVPSAGVSAAAAVLPPAPADPSLDELTVRIKALRQGGGAEAGGGTSLAAIAARTKALRSTHHEEVSDRDLLRRLGALTGKTAEVNERFGKGDYAAAAAAAAASASCNTVGRGTGVIDHSAASSLSAGGFGGRGPVDEVAELLEQAMTEVQLSGGGGSDVLTVLTAGDGVGAAMAGTPDCSDIAVPQGDIADKQQMTLVSEANAAVAAARAELATVQHGDETEDDGSGNPPKNGSELPSSFLPAAPPLFLNDVDDTGDDDGDNAEEIKIIGQVMLELDLEQQMKATNAAAPRESIDASQSVGGSGSGCASEARAAGPSAETATPHLAPPSAVLTTWADETKDRSEELPWCSTCEEDAILRCMTCDEELFCKRCYKRSHRGLSGHTTVRFKGDEYDSQSDSDS